MNGHCVVRDGREFSFFAAFFRRLKRWHPQTREPEYAVVVLLTDGYTPWPDCEPPYPLIVCCTTDADVPVGQVVRMHA